MAEHDRYVDRPRPGFGYLGLLAALAAAMAATAIGVAMSVDSMAGGILLAGAIVVVPTFLLALLTRAAFTTEYQIEDRQLQIRSGPFRASLQVDRITAVERVIGLRQAVFYRSLRRTGLANRLSDWLRIDTADGHHYWVSPSDPERLAAALGSVHAVPATDTSTATR